MLPHTVPECFLCVRVEKNGGFHWIDGGDIRKSSEDATWHPIALSYL